MSRYLGQWTIAWFLACAVFALHIFDEGVNGTFGFYSDLERLLTALLPSLNITPFNFDVWLLNMTGTLVVLFALTRRLSLVVQRTAATRTSDPRTTRTRGTWPKTSWTPPST